MPSSLKGRIVNIERKDNKISYLTQGIPKKEQWKYDKRYPGLNGSYITGSEYHGTALLIKIFVYEYNKCVEFDIRDYVLQENEKKKISGKLLDYVVEQNVGKKVVIEEVEETLYFDFSQLNVKMSN